MNFSIEKRILFEIQIYILGNRELDFNYILNLSIRGKFSILINRRLPFQSSERKEERETRTSKHNTHDSKFTSEIFAQARGRLQQFANLLWWNARVAKCQTDSAAPSSIYLVLEYCSCATQRVRERESEKAREGERGRGEKLNEFHHVLINQSEYKL